MSREGSAAATGRVLGRVMSGILSLESTWTGNVFCDKASTRTRPNKNSTVFSPTSYRGHLVAGHGVRTPGETSHDLIQFSFKELCFLKH